METEMRNFLIVPALATAIAGSAASLALAASDTPKVDVPREQWLSIGQITDKLTAQGYQVRKVKAEDNGYEVDAVDKNGMRLEADIHPVTGEILKSEDDD
jgi:hypothetical protein